MNQSLARNQLVVLPSASLQPALSRSGRSRHPSAVDAILPCFSQIKPNQGKSGSKKFLVQPTIMKSHRLPAIWLEKDRGQSECRSPNPEFLTSESHSKLPRLEAFAKDSGASSPMRNQLAKVDSILYPAPMRSAFRTLSLTE